MNDSSVKELSEAIRQLAKAITLQSEVMLLASQRGDEEDEEPDNNSGPRIPPTL